MISKNLDFQIQLDLNFQCLKKVSKDQGLDFKFRSPEILDQNVFCKLQRMIKTSKTIS